MYQYSMTQWIAGNEDMEYSFQRLKQCGYDGIEFAAEPDSVRTEELNRLLEKYKLSCTSLCGIFPEDRDLTSSDPEEAEAAVRYVKDSIDMAREVGAPYMIVVPSPVGRTAPKSGCTCEEAWKNAVKNVRKAADYAQKRKIFLAIEALNRYETYLVNTMEKNLRFIRDVAHPAVKVMADCFHMSIEESSIARAIRMAAGDLIHVHIADNTREAAGMGNLDFKEILYALKEIRYKGPLTMEFLPRIADPYAAQDMETHTKVMDTYAKQAIDYMKLMERSIG